MQKVSPSVKPPKAAPKDLELADLVPKDLSKATAPTSRRDESVQISSPDG